MIILIFLLIMDETLSLLLDDEISTKLLTGMLRFTEAARTQNHSKMDRLFDALLSQLFNDYPYVQKGLECACHSHANYRLLQSSFFIAGIMPCLWGFDELFVLGWCTAGLLEVFELQMHLGDVLCFPPSFFSLECISGNLMGK